MHAATAFITNSVYLQGVTKASPPITGPQANMLLSKLQEDAVSYAYSGVISMAEAISGVSHQMYSWSTVKAYYAVFYFLRSILANNGLAVFYSAGKPFVLKATPGEQPQKGLNNTHEMVLSEFRKKLSSHWLLTQDIETKDPLSWIKAKREYANYTAARFVEPNTPDHFSQISKFGVRKAIASYILPVNYLLAFDPDHAILAYPLQGLKYAAEEIRGITGNQVFANEEFQFLSTLCRDKTGVIPGFYRLFE